MFWKFVQPKDAIARTVAQKVVASLIELRLFGEPYQVKRMVSCLEVKIRVGDASRHRKENWPRFCIGKG